ncbi:hypothetical protein FIBSPDRAFT_889726 [Athelia psychrophila]|uniref:Uncharacterized protein n=1 Tax=Athelia psychrophila TaxID=1759441 RepID=A0A166LV82_9AGAM|nr:hypothetical protein FIBSPDRAFT_889726 [Fibularhizoctonia sp. CBS 109695]
MYKLCIEFAVGDAKWRFQFSRESVPTLVICNRLPLLVKAVDSDYSSISSIFQHHRTRYVSSTGLRALMSHRSRASCLLTRLMAHGSCLASRGATLPRRTANSDRQIAKSPDRQIAKLQPLDRGTGAAFSSISPAVVTQVLPSLAVASLADCTTVHKL